MLVLSRKTQESIHIGDDIVITVVEVRGKKVRLGITAPPNVSVHREEVALAIKKGVPPRQAIDENQPPED